MRDVRLDQLDVCCPDLYEGCPPGSVRCLLSWIFMRDVLLDQLDVCCLVLYEGCPPGSVRCLLPGSV